MEKNMGMPRHIDWFIKENDTYIKDNIPITTFRLDYKINDEILNEFAKYIRRHYESDEQLANSVAELNTSVEEYLKKLIIPQRSEPFGPTARSNDFTEILIADLFEYVMDFNVPRCKQNNRSGKNSSEHGTDIIAYKFHINSTVPSELDNLLAIEVKAGLTSDDFTPVLNSISDSNKFDSLRHSHTLNYYRKKLESMGCNIQAFEVSRFQKKSEKDYKIEYVAASVISKDYIPEGFILELNGNDIEIKDDNRIFLIHGSRLMDLVHDIYDRCVI